MSWNVTWNGPLAQLAEGLDAEVAKLAFTRSAAEVADATAAARAADRASYNGARRPWRLYEGEEGGLQKPAFFEGKLARFSASGHRNQDGTGSFSLSFALDLAPTVEAEPPPMVPVMPS